MAKRSCRARWGELASRLPASAGIKVFSGSVALSLLADSCERGQAQSQLPRWLGKVASTTLQVQWTGTVQAVYQTGGCKGAQAQLRG